MPDIANPGPGDAPTLAVDEPELPVEALATDPPINFDGSAVEVLAAMTRMGATTYTVTLSDRRGKPVAVVGYFQGDRARHYEAILRAMTDAPPAALRAAAKLLREAAPPPAGRRARP